MKKLLLVDAEPLSRCVLDINLRKSGFHVATAADGAEGLEKIRTFGPHLVIADTRLPKLDGFELLRRIQEGDESATLPVIFIASQEGPDDEERAFELGVDDYLAKPIFLRELIARIHLLFARRTQDHVAIEPASFARSRFAGSVQDLALVDLLQNCERSHTTGVVTLRNDMQEARIYLRDGRVVDAELGVLRGEEAIARALLWGEAWFDVESRPVQNADVVGCSTQKLLMNGMRRVDEWVRLCEHLQPVAALLDIRPAQLLERLNGMQQIPTGLDGVLGPLAPPSIAARKEPARELVEAHAEPPALATPAEPFAPVGRVEPFAPVSPAGPFAPVAPVEPFAPVAWAESAQASGRPSPRADEAAAHPLAQTRISSPPPPAQAPSPAKVVAASEATAQATSASLAQDAAASIASRAQPPVPVSEAPSAAASAEPDETTPVRTAHATKTLPSQRPSARPSAAPWTTEVGDDQGPIPEEAAAGVPRPTRTRSRRVVMATMGIGLALILAGGLRSLRDSQLRAAENARKETPFPAMVAAAGMRSADMTGGLGAIAVAQATAEPPASPDTGEGKAPADPTTLGATVSPGDGPKSLQFAEPSAPTRELALDTKLAPGRQSAVVQEAERALLKGDVARALSLAHDAVQAEPIDADTWLTLAAAQKASGDLAGARDSYRTCIARSHTEGVNHCRILGAQAQR